MGTSNYNWTYIDSGVADKSTQMNSTLDEIDASVASGGGQAVSLGGFYKDTPGTSDEIWKFIASFDIDFADDFAGSYAHASTAPSGGAVQFDVKVEGASIGHFEFADAAQTATFVTDGTTEALDAGERITIESPGNLYSIADIAWTFHGTRG
jgi:hypothetical protein